MIRVKCSRVRLQGGNASGRVQPQIDQRINDCCTYAIFVQVTVIHRTMIILRSPNVCFINLVRHIDCVYSEIFVSLTSLEFVI